MILDFALMMFVALVGTGTVWGLDRLLWAKARAQRADALERAGKGAEAAQARREPAIVEYARAFFPVILIVFVIRSFLVEPFRIPSGSMMPNLFNGDFILVNKFSFGVRLPVVNQKVIGLADPKRGDVVVFRFPGDPSINYIKRVVGVPGDHVVYRRKRLYINGVPMEQSGSQAFSSAHISAAMGEVQRVAEDLDGRRHDILLVGRAEDGFSEFRVPTGHYFVMGDNRDQSNDSRYWGFVPDQHLVGKAFLVWFSLDTVGNDKWLWQRVLWGRIGNSIH
jgi:signal peptidase I